MCWVGKNNPKIAESDIPITKILLQDPRTEMIFSYYQRRQGWKLNEIVESKITIERSFEDGRIEISYGLHAFNIISFLKGKDGILQTNTGVVFTEKDNTNLLVVEGFIPKGSLYYLNDEHEIVANKMVITKIL